MSRIFSLLIILVLTSSCDKTKVIYVASSLADCTSNAAQKCLQVKESQEDEWTVLNNDIEGFEHKDGFLQKIEVRISKIKNPPTDGSVFNYKFIKLIFEQEEEKSSKLALSKDHTGKWKVHTIAGMDSLPVQPTLTFKDGNISGNAGCNSYGTSFSVVGNEITFSLVNSTKMFCTNMPVEKAYFECLSKAKSYKIVDGVLSMYDANDIELMQCIAIED